MRNNLTVSKNFDALNSVIADAKAWPERRKQLKDAMMLEPKTALMAQLTNILWGRPSIEIVEAILDELTTAEQKSLAASYGIGESE
jgi:hypothetical protein